MVFGDSDETNKDIEDHLSMGRLNSGSVTDGRKPKQFGSLHNSKILVVDEAHTVETWLIELTW